MSKDVEAMKDVNKSPHAEREERILAFWDKNRIFQKSLEKDSPRGEFTFYDGPPFATGLPHYGHILAGTMKDVIPRYKTMQGYHVRRRWGWDCHGLPVENLIEKELGLKSKKDILDYGIGRFNASARSSVMRYADEWRRIVPRLGRFVDMDNDYRTMDASYTESVWWIFKRLYDKGLIYEGFKSMNLCPRCETTLSNFEVAQGYKDIADISVYIKFKIKSGQKIAGTEVGDNTYILAWTTTPWTLPGNTALAVNPEIEYVKLIMDAGVEAGKTFIVVKNRLSAISSVLSKDSDPSKIYTTTDIKGSDLVGLSYEPIFNYYANDKALKNRENGWKIYGADFVTTEDGTGVVHIAPAFGADDYELSLKQSLPFVQHVSVDGSFKSEWVNNKDLQDLGLAGVQVKPKATEENKNAHQDTDVKIIKYLARTGALFDKQKINHSYPHCWRCETPLLNYATSSWFVKVTDIKDKLVKENSKIAWVPREIGEGRFGNWLMGARDWAISRSRFWGAPIPVWREENTKNIHVIGSIRDLKKYSKAKNTYYAMRHGEAENNVKGIVSGDAKVAHHLTHKGRQQVEGAISRIREIKPDIVFVSPFVRTLETLDILKAGLNWNKNDYPKIVVDERIRELGSGTWNGRPVKDFIEHFSHLDRFAQSPDHGENYADIKKRMGDFLYDIDKQYSGKKILIISHETPIFLFMAAAQGLNRTETLSTRNNVDEFIHNAEVREVPFAPIPHNTEYELDLHRPFIDDIELHSQNGNRLMRVQDVFDCWFESGAMPYGEAHYPFEKGNKLGEEFDPAPSGLKGLFGKTCGYPADFIAEGLDQTRGWFYSMLVLGVALFGKTSYKKVLVNGLVLAEDGEKMSKSKKNFPDPMILVDKYGADALRYYLMSPPVVRSQDLRFSEKGVDEITKKLVNRLLNVVSFYEMYSENPETSTSVRSAELASLTLRSDSPRPHTSTVSGFSNHILDKWIVSRLNETIHAVTTGLEDGELDRASRPFMDLVDDLSTWYLRRSRDRFKSDNIKDKTDAIETTRYILLETAKILAPIMPFLAEDIYSRLGGKMESVHLESWPKLQKIDKDVSEAMEKVQRIASQGLEARTSAKINVRQPLASLTVYEDSSSLTEEMLELIKDEVNVKNIIFATKSVSDSVNVVLDTEITKELKEEGIVREILRLIQDSRKAKGLTVNDRAVLSVSADPNLKNIIEKNKEMILRITSLSSIEYRDVDSEGIKIGDYLIKIAIK